MKMYVDFFFSASETFIGARLVVLPLEEITGSPQLLQNVSFELIAAPHLEQKPPAAVLEEVFICGRGFGGC